MEGAADDTQSAGKLRMNPQVDQYLLEGCGRCPLYQSPDCKVHAWPEVLRELRRVTLACGLQEDYKWSQPCYTLNGKNVLIVTAFKDYACISFFKGALLDDPHKLLITPGKSSQAARQLRFTDARKVLDLEPQIKSYIFAAIEVEKAGKQIEFKKEQEPVPVELQKKFDADPDFELAFRSLTPGRRRGYLLHFSQPKQSNTRTARIEKWMETIMNGEGMHDGYRAKRK